MTLRGSLQDFPLRVVIDLLTQQRKTGELQVRAGDRVGALGLAEGRVVTAVFGEEEPLLSLAAVFALDGAEFEFTSWDDAPPANLSGTLDELLKQADEAKKQAEEARRKAEAEREAERKRVEEMRALIPNDRVRFRLSERAVDQGAVTFTSERWRVVLAVNGERDVTAIAALLHLEPAAALTALAGLVRDGVIDPIVPTEEPPAPIPAPPSVEPAQSFAPMPDVAPPAEPPPPAQEWIPPAEVAIAPEWTPPPPEPAPTPPPWEQPAPPQWEQATSQTTPQWEQPPPETAPPWEQPAGEAATPPEHWGPAPSETPAQWEQTAPQGPPSWTEPASEPAAPAQDWGAPQPAESTPATDDRLSALSGIFGPAPTEGPPAPAQDTWSAPAPTGNQWTNPAPAGDPWGASTPSAPPQSAPTAGMPPQRTPVPDSWGAPATQSAWTAPSPPQSPPAPAPGADPWGAPLRSEPRSPMSIPEPGTPAVEEWGPPAAPAPEKKKRGLFGWGREKPASPPVAGQPLPTAGVVGTRTGMLAALANSLISEYNNGQYGKGRIDERMANLLMRVDEQADPIDRPLPIVDDRIDVQALEREKVAEQQALPYLALLVSTIFADAEKTFGKDKAKKGYKAATKNVLLGDASALQTPELAGKLPKV